MTNKQARIAKLTSSTILNASEADVRELISYSNDKQLRDTASKIQAHIKTIARKEKHYAQYWKCKDMLQWIRDEENKRPLDIFADCFPLKSS